MDVKKILFINTEIAPYVTDSDISSMGKLLPETMQANGYEIRTFMPKWGNINERRGQLHEVIRLSGLNIVINDTDYPLLIKVASIPVSRVQVYFIDNEDLFAKKNITRDKEGKEYANNAERAVFFTRGVLETVKKLRWVPDVIHCQGWMAAVMPIFLKKVYCDDPAYKDVKVVTSLFHPDLDNTPNDKIKSCLISNDIDEEIVNNYSDAFDLVELGKMAIDYSDGIIEVGENISPAILEHLEASGKPHITCKDSDFKETYKAFYNSL